MAENALRLGVAVHDTAGRGLGQHEPDRNRVEHGLEPRLARTQGGHRLRLRHAAQPRRERADQKLQDRHVILAQGSRFGRMRLEHAHEAAVMRHGHRDHGSEAHLAAGVPVDTVVGFAVGANERPPLGDA